MENSASRKNWLVCSLRKSVPVSMLVSMATIMFAGMTLIWPLAFGHEGSVVAGRTPNLSPQMEKLPMEKSEGLFQMFIYPHPSRSCWAHMLGPDKEELIGWATAHTILKQEYSSLHLLGIFHVCITFICESISFGLDYLLSSFCDGQNWSSVSSDGWSNKHWCQNSVQSGFEYSLNLLIMTYMYI